MLTGDRSSASSITRHANSANGRPRRAPQIFDAALTLLAELGYDGLTVEGIAERSGRRLPPRAATRSPVLAEHAKTYFADRPARTRNV
ncbi:MAG TPA: hypothetical protein VHN80_27080 [Kineosporiaceae bacterium]|nr:hypothetical protein [Kineosporiaceae bacterium]